MLQRRPNRTELRSMDSYIQMMIFPHPLGVVKGDFLVHGNDIGGTFCLHFWNLHKIWI